MHLSMQETLQILLMYVVVFKYKKSLLVYNPTLLVSFLVGTRILVLDLILK